MRVSALLQFEQFELLLEQDELQCRIILLELGLQPRPSKILLDLQLRLLYVELVLHLLLQRLIHDHTIDERTGVGVRAQRQHKQGSGRQRSGILLHGTQNTTPRTLVSPSEASAVAESSMRNGKLSEYYQNLSVTLRVWFTGTLSSRE